MGRSVLKKPAAAMKKRPAATRRTARYRPKYRSMSLEAWTAKYYPNDVKRRDGMENENMDIDKDEGEGEREMEPEEMNLSQATAMQLPGPSKNHPRKDIRSKQESPSLSAVVTEVKKLLDYLRDEGEVLTVEQLGWNVMERLDEAWFTGSVPGIENVARSLQNPFYPDGGFRSSKNLGSTTDVSLFVDAIWRDAVNFAEASCKKVTEEC
ncbi:unnamed protein product [Symbiodinium sp. CCMP2592]|nr:unnamed protein product [Symbiodinium sp. CCMP2592]